jgi:hypothetical protein
MEAYSKWDVMYLVKGVVRRVIVVKSPDPRIFEEAIFIVKEDATRQPGVTYEDILKEARNAANEYIRENMRGKRVFSRIPAPAFTVAGAAVTGLIWLAVRFL